MPYDSWGRSEEKERASRRFDEKLFRRKDHASWEEAWHRLSPKARELLLGKARKGPTPTGVSIEGVAPKVVQELIDGGFMTRASGSRGTGRLVLVQTASDFVARLRTLARFDLLDAAAPTQLGAYVNSAFYSGSLYDPLGKVLGAAGIEEFLDLGGLLPEYVLGHRWPGWAVQASKDPVAGRVVEAVREAGGPIPLIELMDRIKDVDRAKVRAAIVTLLAHLALVEDLDPQTLDLRIGFVPAVRAAIEKAGQPRTRPPREACPNPKAPGPDGNLLAEDLRAFLLEIASEPAKIRQDGALFEREVGRFREALPMLPDWLLKHLEWTEDSRLNQAGMWAQQLKLVKTSPDGKSARWSLSNTGTRWLAVGLAEQEETLFEVFRAEPKRGGATGPYVRLSDDLDFGYLYGGSRDLAFLGIDLTVIRPASQRKGRVSYYDAKPEDILALRRSLDKAWSALPAGQFFRLDDVTAHAVYAHDNPLLLDRKPEEVAIFLGTRRIPPLEERLENIGRLVLRSQAILRLIPLGCLRTALDAEGKLCVERTPRLDLYFGRKSSAMPASAAAGPTRVVVQPDFSVVIIGLDPAPAAALAPFSERSTRGGTPGAIVLKLTREAVVKAVAHGLKPDEILSRLKKYATQEVPANVLAEVREWSRWVREVTVSTMTALNCPDRDTADRVVAAFRNHAHRVGDTLVALDMAKLGTPERKKLKDQGILVKGSEAAPATPKTKKRRRDDDW